MKRIVYADNAATTQLDSDAYKAMSEILQREYGNPSQPYSFSRAAKKLLADARESIASCINALPDEIYFTSGGTESDNCAIKSVAFNNSSKAVITSQIEHHAILRSCEFLEKQKFPVVYLPVAHDGIVRPEILKRYITNNVSLVSIMLANNEIGTIQPIGEFAETTHSYGAIFHTDAVQAVGHIKVDVKELTVDMLSASAHKFNGPKGVGFLYIKRGTKLLPYMHGGQQEQGLRAGTENVASIVGMSIALKNNVDHLKENRKLLANLEMALFARLQYNGFSENVNYFRNGNTQEHIDGNVSLSFKGIDGEILLHRLDLMGISVSTGSACDSVNTKISHVLTAIGISQEIAKGTIRISFGKNNVVDDAVYIADSITRVINELV